MLEQVCPQSALEAELTGLYHAHAAELLRYAGTMTPTPEQARDAVQEAFLRFFAERRYGRAIDHPRAWLYQVLRNFLLTALAAGRREVPAENLGAVPDAAADPESRAQRREHSREILARLSPREVDCLRLRAEGRSYSEISDLLDIRIGTVGAILTKAQQKLRWPPGKNGKIGLGTASAIHCLFLETASESS